jgi:prepilin peptidase CpaA
MDLKSNRISNILIATGLAAGLALAGSGGWQALAMAAAGVATGLILFLPAYALAAMGAGDVKLMAVVGAFLGPMDTVIAAIATVIIGGVLGLLLVIGRGGGAATLSRYWLMLRCLCATGRFAYITPAANEAAATEMPYAVAIACGTGWSLWRADALSGFSAAALTLPS